MSEVNTLEFIECVNAGRVKFGFPGHFYVLPFFCVAERSQ